MAKNSGLGKGLGALFGESGGKIDAVSDDCREKITELKITELEPGKSQPRKQFDTDKLQELAQSIREYGIVQPIVVKKQENGYYQIIAGERRWRAARMAGLKKVPAIIRDYDEQKVLEIALIENLQREDLNPVEEAEGYRRLMDELSYTQEQLAEKLGKSRPQIANTLRLLGLSKPVLELLSQGKLTNGHGRCLLALTDENAQWELAQKIIDEGLSVRQAEQLAKNLAEGKQKEERRQVTQPVDVVQMELQHSLQDLFQTKVRVKQKEDKGKIEIEFYSKEDLERILAIIDR